MKLMTKKEFAIWLIDMRQEVKSDEAINLIDNIAEMYLYNVKIDNLSREDEEKLLYNRMRSVYTDFCDNVLKNAPDFDVIEAVALKKRIIPFFRKLVMNASDRRGEIITDRQADKRILEAWQMVLSGPVWMNLRDFYRNGTKLRQIAMNQQNIINEIRELSKSGSLQKEIRKQAEYDEISESIRMTMEGM